MLLCPADYIYNPLTPYRCEIFRRLVSEIKGGDVLDLGCDHVGHYWALGYVSRASSFSLFDKQAHSILKQQQEIENISGQHLEEYFKETIDFLKQEKLLQEEITYDTIAEFMISKLNECREFDYLVPDTKSTFDYILAVESLEAVRTETDFLKGLETARSLLNANGKLLTVVLPWDVKNEDIMERVENGREGTWNPKINQILSSLGDSGFKNIQYSHYKTQMDNYSDAWFISAQI